jgi:apolipoprotein N-acyltransferase
MVGAIASEVFTTPGDTLYNRWSDWFKWTLVGLLSLLVGVSLRRKTIYDSLLSMEKRSKNQDDSPYAC